MRVAPRRLLRPSVARTASQISPMIVSGIAANTSSPSTVVSLDGLARRYRGTRAESPRPAAPVMVTEIGVDMSRSRPPRTVLLGPVRPRTGSAGKNKGRGTTGHGERYRLAPGAGRRAPGKTRAIAAVGRSIRQLEPLGFEVTLEPEA